MKLFLTLLLVAVAAHQVISLPTGHKPDEAKVTDMQPTSGEDIGSFKGSESLEISKDSDVNEDNNERNEPETSASEVHDTDVEATGDANKDQTEEDATISDIDQEKLATQGGLLKNADDEYIVEEGGEIKEGHSDEGISKRDVEKKGSNCTESQEQGDENLEVPSKREADESSNMDNASEEDQVADENKENADTDQNNDQQTSSDNGNVDEEESDNEQNDDKHQDNSSEDNKESITKRMTGDIPSVADSEHSSNSKDSTIQEDMTKEDASSEAQSDDATNSASEIVVSDDTNEKQKRWAQVEDAASEEKETTEKFTDPITYFGHESAVKTEDDDSE